MAVSPARTIIFAIGFTLSGAVLAILGQNAMPTAFAQHDVLRLGQKSKSATDSAAAKVLAQPGEAGPLRHVVLFKFKDDATKEQVQEIVTAFGQLPKKIEGITAYEWGTNVSPEMRSEGFTHCFVVTFKDAKARDAYLPHAAHKALVDLLLPKLDRVLVVDFFAQKG